MSLVIDYQSEAQAVSWRYEVLLGIEVWAWDENMAA